VKALHMGLEETRVLLGAKEATEAEPAK